MALVRNQWCDGCESTTQHINNRCTVCRTIEEKARLALWNSKPVNDRLNDLRKRIEKLEQGPPVF